MTSLFRVALLLVLMVGAQACGEDTDHTRMEQGGATEDPMRTGDQGVVSAAPNEEPRPVDVHLKEYEISMPTSLKPGAHLFRVTNDGAEPHGLTVSGNGQDLSLPTNAQPGETQALPVDLAPGTYRVFCPVDGHADRGMALDITVSE